MHRITSDDSNYPRGVSDRKWKKATERREIRKEGRTRRWRMRNGVMEKRNERDAQVTRSNQEHFHSTNNCLFQSYNFPFIVGEGERSGRGDASRCFARAWAVTPVLVNLKTP